MFAWYWRGNKKDALTTSQRWQFAELAASCKYAKKVRDIQVSLMGYLDVPSWEVAMETLQERAIGAIPWHDLSQGQYTTIVHLLLPTGEAFTCVSTASGVSSNCAVVAVKTAAIPPKVDVLTTNTKTSYQQSEIKLQSLPVST